MNRNILRAAAVLVLPLLLALQACQTHWPAAAQPARRRPVVYPDYGETVVPPNIAPLNVQIKEPGVRFRARIEGEKGGAVVVETRDGIVQWPERAWKQLLERNRGAGLSLTVTVRSADGAFRVYDPIPIGVAREALDRYIVYRLIPPIDHYYSSIGIFQRDLVLLGHKRLAPQKGQQGSCRAMAFASRWRRLAIENGSTRCPSFLAPPRPIFFRLWRQTELEPSRAC